MKKDLDNIFLIMIGSVFILNLWIDSALWSDIIIFAGFVLVLILVILNKIVKGKESISD